MNIKETLTKEHQNPRFVRYGVYLILLLSILGSWYYHRLGYGPDAVGCGAFSHCKDADYRWNATFFPIYGIFVAFIWWLVASVVVAIKNTFRK